MDTTDPKIVFDARGHCDHCNNYDTNVVPFWHTDARGEAELMRMADEIRTAGKGKDHKNI